MWDAQNCLLFCSQCSINPTFNQDRKFNLIKHNSQHSVPKLSDIKTLINTISWPELMPHPHYARGILKRCFCLKTYQMFPIHTIPKKFENTTYHRSFWICVWRKLEQGNHMIVVTSLFLKSSIFKMFCTHTKMQSRRFQISPVWKAYQKSYQDRLDSVDSRPNPRQIKLCFQISQAHCQQGLNVHDICSCRILT